MSAPEPYRTLFLTTRGQRHQQAALRAAPPVLDVVMLRQPERQELISHLEDAVFLISERSGEIDAEMIQGAPRLRMILRLGSLAHDIDLAAAGGAGVVVSLWPVRGSVMVAEHTMLQMLALARRLRETSAVALEGGSWGLARRTGEDTFAYNWSGRHGIGGLWQKRVGILGFGEIGAELARRLRGWGCAVSYYRRRRLPPQVEAGLGVSYSPYEALLAGSDFLVNLLPYSAETDGLLGASAFERMPPGACLVSCGSGSVIDEAALAAALQVGRLAGAALDTFEWEPLPADNPLRLLAVADPHSNILLTPHIAAGAPPGGTAPGRQQDFLPILQFLNGEPLPHRLV